MLRVVLQTSLLFLAPFAAYAAYLSLRRRFPFAVDHWTQGAVSTLALVGLAVAVAGTLLLGVFAERHQGAYVPAHVEDGRLVPGRMQ